MKQSIITIHLQKELKQAFVAWCKSEGFTSMSEALRGYIREVTKNDKQSQEGKPPNSLNSPT